MWPNHGRLFSDLAIEGSEPVHWQIAKSRDHQIAKSRTRRGGILFEVVLAVALFGGAAAFTLAAVRSVFTTLERTRRQQQAIDLARSKLAELEAGLIPLSELRRGESGELEPWEFDCQVHRTEFTGLSLVELTVRESRGDEAMSYTLRQLLPLRGTQRIDDSRLTIDDSKLGHHSNRHPPSSIVDRRSNDFQLLTAAREGEE